MSDLHRLRRYDFQEGDGEPNSDLAELIGDIHWAADEIERLQAVVDAVRELAKDVECFAEDAGGYVPTWFDVAKALAALEEDERGR